jgi:uncharacterized protein YdiU (UPF0061 family)
MIRLTDRFTSRLPGDVVAENYPRQLQNVCYSSVLPKGMAAPALLHCNRQLAESLGIGESVCSDPVFAEWMAGNRIAPGSTPYAMRYGGHQFGQWAGQLGDGRAINLGEVPTQDGWIQLQLKGAGPTPYSRTADGLAVLRSSVREYLCSEAMHCLGIPTTRALALVSTGEGVTRDMFYDGNPRVEPGAIVCRTAPNFIRFGNFEILAADRNPALLASLTEFTIEQSFAQLCNQPDKYLAFFKEVAERTCRMIVEWQRVGFVHGVMNTDNMSILGLTIDYGPYGWIDDYDPRWTPNTTDLPGRRYCFGNQPAIAQWNLLKLANALFSLIEDEGAIKEVLVAFKDQYEEGYLSMMRQKLGLASPEETDEGLVSSLEQTMTESLADMTLFFRKLADVDADTSPEEIEANFSEALYSLPVQGKLPDALMQWIGQYQFRLQSEKVDASIRKQRMNTVNPKYVLRNYMAQLAIEEAEKGDLSVLKTLFTLLQRPYDEQPEMARWFARRPDWAREKAGCSMLSCSS